MTLLAHWKSMGRDKDSEVHGGFELVQPKEGRKVSDILRCNILSRVLTYDNSVKLRDVEHVVKRLLEARHDKEHTLLAAKFTSTKWTVCPVRMPSPRQQAGKMENKKF